MKIAVCLSGHMRDFDRKFASLHECLVRDNDADFFIHTWETFGYSVNNPGSMAQYGRDGFDRRSPRIDSTHVHDLYNPVSLVVEDFEKFEPAINREASYFTRRREGTRVENLISLHRKIFLTDRLRQDYEEMSGVRYDVVVRARPDLLYEREVRFDEHDLSLVTTPEELSFGVVSDAFAFGAPDVMTRFCGFYPRMKETYDTMGSVINPHTFLLDWFHFSGVEGHKLPLGITK